MKEVRERLLDVAEKHFAINGYAGASQRAIQREVDVNVATANYYFGSKEALFRAVVERYLPRIVEHRAKLWSQIPAHLKGYDRLEAMLKAYLRPHLEVTTQPNGDAYGRIVARLAANGMSPSPNAFLPNIEPFRQVALSELIDIFPQIEKVKVAQALSFTITLMLTAPFDRNYTSLVNSSGRHHTPDAWIDSLTKFSMGGFQSLCGPPS